LSPPSHLRSGKIFWTECVPFFMTVCSKKLLCFFTHSLRNTALTSNPNPDDSFSALFYDPFPFLCVLSADSHDLPGRLLPPPPRKSREPLHSRPVCFFKDDLEFLFLKVCPNELFFYEPSLRRFPYRRKPPPTGLRGDMAPFSPFHSDTLLGPRAFSLFYSTAP